MAEGKSASEASNDDFPPDVVNYLTRGIESAINAPLPDALEAEQWVFGEAGY
jgi:pyruvate dehydrogenase E1 component alpha subunit